MALSHVGNTDLTSSRAVSVPPPSSLCPCCGKVEADAKQYRRGQVDEAIFICDSGHNWLMRWIEVA